MLKLYEVSKNHKYMCLWVSTENYITRFYSAVTEAMELILYEKRTYKENFLQSNPSPALFSEIFIDASSLVRKRRGKKKVFPKPASLFTTWLNLNFQPPLRNRSNVSLYSNSFVV